MMLCSSVSAILFLSTPSARRATRQGIITHLHKHDFYPRPPRGGRRRLFRLVSQRDTISIHALREEGDSLSTAKVLWISISIHALREEGDATTRQKKTQQPISIHALREEGDLHGWSRVTPK